MLLQEGLHYKLNMKTKKLKTGLTVLTILLLLLSLIDPVYPKEQFLQHTGTVFLLSFLVVDIFKNKWERSSFIGLLLFTLLHILGARYIYSFVPYNDWIVSLTGFNFQDYFDFQRNHFDRFVHFSFGILLFPLCFHLFRKKINGNYKLSAFIAWACIQSFSLIYEVFEWLLTLLFSGEAAENYNGQQGDVWDPQKDMALALLGSSLMLVFYLVKYRFLNKEK